MRTPLFSMASFALCLLLLHATSAIPKFDATGIYDSDEQINGVDKSASYEPAHSTGSGRNRTLILTIDVFSSLITEAYTNSQGGVINFDNGLIEAGQQTDSFAAMFDDRAVVFESIDHIRSDYVSNTRTPISGPGKSPNGGFLAKSTVRGDACMIGGSYQLTLKEYRFEPEEHVRVVAGTILSRNNSDQSGEWVMQVTLDNGDIVASSATVNMYSGNTVDDTFFGACAPAGRYITGASWICKSGEFAGLDDLAFITGKTDFSLPSIDVDPALQPSSAEPWDSADGAFQSDTTLFGREKIIW